MFEGKICSYSRAFTSGMPPPLFVAADAMLLAAARAKGFLVDHPLQHP